MRIKNGEKIFSHICPFNKNIYFSQTIDGWVLLVGDGRSGQRVIVPGKCTSKMGKKLFSHISFCPFKKIILFPDHRWVGIVGVGDGRSGQRVIVPGKCASKMGKNSSLTSAHLIKNYTFPRPSMGGYCWHWRRCVGSTQVACCLVFIISPLILTLFSLICFSHTG